MARRWNNTLLSSLGDAQSYSSSWVQWASAEMYVYSTVRAELKWSVGWDPSLSYGPWFVWVKAERPRRGSRRGNCGPVCNPTQHNQFQRFQGSLPIFKSILCSSKRIPAQTHFQMLSDKNGQVNLFVPPVTAVMESSRSLWQWANSPGCWATWDCVI